MASGSGQGATGEGSDSGHSSVTHSNGHNIAKALNYDEDNDEDDDINEEDNSNNDNANGDNDSDEDVDNSDEDDNNDGDDDDEIPIGDDGNGGQHKASILVHLAYMWSMIAAVKQVQHVHWTGTLFMTVSPEEELGHATRLKEPPVPILDDQPAIMEHPFPCKDPHVVIYTSILVQELFYQQRNPIPSL